METGRSSINVIDAQMAAAGGAFRVRPSRDRDLAGIWRLAGFSVGLVIGSAAVHEARQAGYLTRRQQLLAIAVAGTYAGAGVYATLRPDWLVEMVGRRPRRTLIAAAVPLAGTFVTGGQRTPLHTLAAACAGGSAMIYGRRTGHRVALAAMGAWTLGARSVSIPAGADRPSAAWVYLVMPLAYLANARTAATLASLAYNARSLDAMLQDLMAEREQIRRSAGQLGEELAAASVLLRATLSGSELDAERELALRALGRVHEAAAAVRATLGEPALPSRPGVIEYAVDWLTSRGIYGRTRPLPPQRALASELCREQIAELDWLMPAGVSIAVSEQDARPQDGAPLEVVGAARIAVFSAAVASALVNAVRHSPRLTCLDVRVTARDGLGELTVENDGDTRHPAGPARLGKGLSGIAREAGHLGGTLTAEHLDGDRFRLTVCLPTRDSASSQGGLLRWEEIEAKLDNALAEATAMCGMMVWAGLFVRHDVLWQNPLRTLPSAAIPFAEHVARRDGRPRHWPLVAAAAVSAVNDDPHRGILCGWLGAALAHHGFHHPRPLTAGLTAVDLLGIAAAYRDLDVDRGRLSGQLATVAAAVSAMLTFTLPAVHRLRGHERNVVASLAMIETVDRVVLEMHSRHSCIDTIAELAARCDEPERSALETSAAAIRRVTTRRAESYQTMLAALVGEAGSVIGRRIWPAPISVTIDPAASAALDEGGQLYRKQVRATVLAVADRVAREAIGYKAVRWTGERPVHGVELTVAPASRATANIAFSVDPVHSSGAAGAERLCERITELGALVTDWTPEGRLTFVIYPEPG